MLKINKQYYITKLLSFDDYTFYLMDHKKLQQIDPNWDKIRGCWGKYYIPDDEIWLSDRLYIIYKNRIDISKRTFIETLITLMFHEYIETKIVQSIGKDKNQELDYIAHKIAIQTQDKITFKNKEKIYKKIYNIFSKKLSSNIKSNRCF